MTDGTYKAERIYARGAGGRGARCAGKGAWLWSPWFGNDNLFYGV
ncbi:uncharacterized protein METZ01_LOCUS273894, partial [marine metagenome]